MNTNLIEWVPASKAHRIVQEQKGKQWEHMCTIAGTRRAIVRSLDKRELVFINQSQITGETNG